MFKSVKDFVLIHMKRYLGRTKWPSIGQSQEVLLVSWDELAMTIFCSFHSLILSLASRSE